MYGMLFHAAAVFGVICALSLGYIVCYLASKTAGGLKVLGFTIGIGIIAVVAILLIGNLFIMGIYGCPDMSGGSMMCPMMKGMKQGGMAGMHQGPMMMRPKVGNKGTMQGMMPDTK